MSPDHYQRHGTASYDVHDIERRKKKLAHGSIVSRLLPFRNEPSVPHTRIPGQRNSGRFLLAEETFSDGHPIEVSFSTKVLRTSGSWSPLCDPGFLIDVHELFEKDPPGPVDIHLELLEGGPATGPHRPLLIGGTETDCVSVGVGDCSQKSNRTLAVQRRNDSHRDFIAGVQGIRSLCGSS